MKNQQVPVVLFLIIGIVSCLAFTVYVLKEKTLVASKVESQPTPVATIQPSPSPKLDQYTVIEDAQEAGWKKYTNKKIGVSFEYPEYYQIEEMEFDERTVPTNYPPSPYPTYIPRYGFDISFTHKENLDDKPYPVSDFSFNITMQDNAGYFETKYADYKPSFTKKIGQYEWRRYPGIDCSNKPKDGVICTDTSGGPLLSYRTHINKFEYFFNLRNKSLENSLEFKKIIESTNILDLNLDKH